MTMSALKRARAIYELASMKLEDKDYRERLFARGATHLADSLDEVTKGLPIMIRELDQIIKKCEVYHRKSQELEKELEGLDDNQRTNQTP